MRAIHSLSARGRRMAAIAQEHLEAQPPIDEARPTVARFAADLAEVAAVLAEEHPARVTAAKAVADACAKLRRYDDGFYSSEDKLPIARAAWAAIEAASNALASARTAAGLSYGELGLSDERERLRVKALRGEGER